MRQIDRIKNLMHQEESKRNQAGNGSGQPLPNDASPREAGHDGATEKREPKSNSKARPGLSVTCLANVEREAVSWLWEPRIPLGKVTLMEGVTRVGKSSVSMAIAAKVSKGGFNLGGPSNVLLASAEDGLADTILPRLDANGADVSRIFAFQEGFTLNQAGLSALESAAEEHEVKLIIIDPLVAFLAPEIDIFRGNHIRAFMSQLGEIAKRLDCAILVVRHLTKGSRDRYIYRGVGGIDFTAACRSVLLVGCDPENPAERAVVQIKNNLAPLAGSVGFTIEPDGSLQIKETTTLTAGKILSSFQSDEDRQDLNDEIDFLRDELSEGPRPAKEIEAEARKVGISSMTLRRARGKLSIKPKKQGQPGKSGQRWDWGLPEGPHCV